MKFRAVNLMPRKRLEMHQTMARLRSWGITLGACLALMIAVCVAAHLIWGQELRPLERDAEAAAEKLKSVERELAAARGKLREAITRETTVREVLDQPDWGAMIQSVARRRGDEIVLRDLRVRGHAGSGVAVTGTRDARQRNYRLELRGLSKGQGPVGKFVSALEAMGLFDEVRLVRTGREPFENVAAVSFEIECSLSDRGTR